MTRTTYHGSMNTQSDTFVTGGTGLLGRWLVVSLTRRNRHVAAMVRGGAERGEALRSFVGAHGGVPERLLIVDGDVCEEGLGIAPKLSEVRDVYHLAAAFAFGMAPERARAINVQGTLRVAEWARGRSKLRRLVHLGGYRATKMPAWLAQAELPLCDTQRKRLYRECGAYEASKLESHLEVRAFARVHKMPLTILNPSTVIGDSRTGETTQVSGLGETVRDLFAGKLPALAGNRRTNLPLVAVDHLAEMLATVPERKETIGQELCVLDPNTPRLPELVEQIGRHLGVPAPKRILSVGLLRALPKALTGIEPEALTFLTDDDYDTTTADAHAQAAGVAMPSFDTTLERWATYLVASRFGEVSDPEPARFVAASGSRTYVVGDPVHADNLFLHGLPWDGESWRPVSELVAGKSARPDLPGLGRSSACTGPSVQWLSALLEGRDKPLTIIGHSLGTALAIRYAHAFPEKVGALVLTSPFFFQGVPSWPLRTPVLSSRLFALGGADTLQRQLLGGAGDDLHPAVASAHAQLRRRGVAKRVATALAGASEATERAELLELYTELRLPILIIHGEDDPLLTPPPFGDIATIAAAGHNPHLQFPRETSEVIEEWLRTQYSMAPRSGVASRGAPLRS